MTLFTRLKTGNFLFLMILSFLAAIKYTYHIRKEDPLPNTFSTLYFYLLINTPIFIGGLYVYKNLRIGLNPWILSRLIEVPFYTTIFCAICILTHSKNKALSKGIITVCLILWGIVPLLSNNGVQNWVKNAKTLKNLKLGSLEHRIFYFKPQSPYPKKEVDIVD